MWPVLFIWYREVTIYKLSVFNYKSIRLILKYMIYLIFQTQGDNLFSIPIFSHWKEFIYNPLPATQNLHYITGGNLWSNLL